MKTPNDFNVEKVYSYNDAEDLKNYYNDWAHEYEDYTNQVNYVLPEEVVKIFSKYNLKDSSTILDIGCGTGLVGCLLAKISNNFWIEGLDVSRSMVQIAMSKARSNFKPVYNWIIIEDFKTNKLLLEEHYDAIVSAGTFTSGHLDADDLLKSIDYLKKDGLMVVSVKEDHFQKEKFDDKISSLKNSNTIKEVEFFKVNSYNSSFLAESIIVKFLKV